MPAFSNWKFIAIALLVTIHSGLADNVEASPNQPRDFPLKDSPQSSSFTTPIDAASLVAYKDDWGTDLTQQVPNQHLDDTDSLFLASENDLCQTPQGQSQTPWQKRRARLRRGDSSGSFCAVDSQKFQPGVPAGQQPSPQTQERNGQKRVTGELKVTPPYTPRRGGSVPSGWKEFGQDVLDGVIMMGQPNEDMCSKPSNANRKTPVCHIGYPPMPREVMTILPQVRAGKLTIQFLRPNIHIRHPQNSGYINQTSFNLTISAFYLAFSSEPCGGLLGSFEQLWCCTDTMLHESRAYVLVSAKATLVSHHPASFHRSYLLPYPNQFIYRSRIHVTRLWE